MMQKTPDMLQDPKLVPISATGAVTHHMQKASNVKLESSSVKYAINFATSHQYASKKAKANTPSNSFHTRKPKAQQLCAGALYTLQDVGSSEYDSDPEENFCLQMKVHRTRISHPEVPKPVYLMANLAYHLKEHHTRNQ